MTLRVVLLIQVSDQITLQCVVLEDMDKQCILSLIRRTPKPKGILFTMI